MWLEFSLAFAISILFLYLPGLLVSHGIGIRSIASAFCIAPIISVFFYGAAPILFEKMGIPSNALSLFLPLFVIGLTLCVLRTIVRLVRKKAGPANSNNPNAPTFPILALYVFLGIVAVLFVFVKNLDGASSFYQAYDNFNHLGVVRSFVENQNYSSFSSSLYAGTSTSPFIAGTAFYPCAWHALVALVVSTFEFPITLAINAVNSVLLGIVFPSAICFLLATLFPNEQKVVKAGAISAVGTAICPWDFVAFGPLYPNLLSMVLVPLVISVFIISFRCFTHSSPIEAVKYLLLFFIASIAVALAQPNGIFTAGIFLAAFCVHETHRLARKHFPHSSRKPFILAGGITLAAVCAWTGCFLLPSFQGVVWFNWPATVSIPQAIINVLTFGLASQPAQLAIAAFTIFGSVTIIREGNHRWLVFPCLFVCLAYVFDTATEGPVKHFLCGFWYSDPHRIAQMIGLFSMPLSAYGMDLCLERLGKHRFTVSLLSKFRAPLRLYTAAAPIALIAIIFFPSFSINGLLERTTPFGYLRATIESQNDTEADNVLSPEELDFSRKALALIPEGSLIINSPNDGSGFLYALEGANIYYRQFALPSIENETAESQEIRFSLDQLSDNTKVQRAVKNIGASYLLLLDQGHEASQAAPHFWSYYPDQWTGIESIDDETPGFECILSEGDMRLYKIVIK